LFAIEGRCVILPFFYGWLIVAITMVAGFLAAGVSNITMAVVLKPISEDLGWSRTLTAAAITLGACLGGLLSPLFGPIADRLGSSLAGGRCLGRPARLRCEPQHGAVAVLRDFCARASAHRVPPVRHDRLHHSR